MIEKEKKERLKLYNELFYQAVLKDDKETAYHYMKIIENLTKGEN